MEYIEAGGQRGLEEILKEEERVSAGVHPEAAPHYLKWRKHLLTQSFLKRDENAAQRRLHFLQIRKEIATKRTKQEGTEQEDMERAQKNIEGENSSLDGSKKKKKKKKVQEVEEKGTVPRSDQIALTSKKVNEAYAFAGMHHIFVEHTKPVTMIKFANHDRDLLAFCCVDGKISICHALHSPRIMRSLQGHLEAVTEFEWSTTNDMILSCSMDKSIKVWLVHNGDCVRTFTEDGVCGCCKFHPINNNCFVAASSDGKKSFLKSYNLSTGKVLKKLSVPGAIQCIDFSTTGEFMFAGDVKGFVTTYRFDMVGGTMQLIGKSSVADRPVQSLNFREWLSSASQPPSLLVNCCDSTIKLFWVQKKPTSTSQIVFNRQFPVVNIKETVRSRFCPLISNRDGACIVSGSEDSVIYIFDVKRPQPCINQLQGHSGVVHDVSWNYDESLLASCDTTGTVIIWKRILQVEHVE